MKYYLIYINICNFVKEVGVKFFFTYINAFKINFKLK